MKRKKHTTEQKVRILMDAKFGGKNLDELCRENNISKLTFHRWKRQYGQLDVHKTCRLIELERNKLELEKRLAEWALRHRLLSCLSDSLSHLPV
jgi:putative transposase